jgi:hypothetical protein
MNTEILESFYDMAVWEMNNQVINPDLLMDSNIKSYILEKLQQKATNYPQFLNLNFKTQKDFDIFNKNLIGEIYRQFLNIVRAAKKYNPIAKTKIEKKLEKAVISYLDLKNCFTGSLNAVVSVDGKKTELQDLIPAKSWVSYEESKSSTLFNEEDIENDEIRIKNKYNKREKAEEKENESLQMALF